MVKRASVVLLLVTLAVTSYAGAQQVAEPSPLETAKQLLAQNLEIGDVNAGRAVSPTAAEKTAKLMADGLVAARAAVKAQPKSAEAHYLLGALLSLAYRPAEGKEGERVMLVRGAKGQPEMMEGMAELRKGAQLQPQNVNYQLDYARALLVGGQMKAAQVELDSIAKRFPNLKPNERATLAQLRSQAAPPAPSKPTYVNWQSYDQGMAAAQKEGKRALVDFMAEWCGWCKKMDKDVYTNPSVIALSSKYVFIKVDADQRPDLTKKYGVTGFPTVVLFDSGGREINRIVGYVDAQRFLQAVQ
jgi:thiol-disulfide isomerase/thioredoxin